AMNEGGYLSIRTENRSVETPVHGFETIPPGRYAALIVQDTGTGIDTEEIARIFEPFFTKKKMGHSGTGLGMAVVWSVVKDHGGFIEVLSQKGVGTRFEVYWPATVAAPAEGDTPALRDYPGKGESILVVDDAPEMREIACHMITALGYQAVAVPNGDAAVRYLTGQPMDLVVLDMVMDPGMDGLETFKRILTVRPGQKVIITSGFAETDRVATARTMGVLAYLKKPYLVEELARTIRIALDSSIPAGPD
ncbi:MAG: response regulator, partial [Desulfatitalea sp.]|nr:response regulator [Desulfatitalea sp.]